MTKYPSDFTNFTIRPLQYRDIEGIKNLAANSSEASNRDDLMAFEQELERLRRWYGLFKVLSWFPNPFAHHTSAYVAEFASPTPQIQGMISILPLNSSRSTWKVEQVLVNENGPTPQKYSDPQGAAFQLLRHCFETVWEARTWVLEVNIHEKGPLALYRQNGFQPLAQMTYWLMSPDLLEKLAQNEPDLPNLLPVSNADAQLLYQLDCVSMPPLLRQVFDLHVQDFKVNFLTAIMNRVKQWCGDQEVSRGYVFEPQRKAAIGYFELILSKEKTIPHKAKLTVHPAYTWLYPKLLTQMARIVQKYPCQSLELVSADYQHEREEYLDNLGAKRVEHTLLMSRSVWHKLREVKQEGLQLAEMLQSLQAVPRQPIPTPWLKMSSRTLPSSTKPDSSNNGEKPGDSGEKPHNGSGLSGFKD